MILVFIFTLIFISLLVITLLLSTLKIRIEKLDLSNYTKGKILNNYELHIELYLLNKIKILDIKINESVIGKLKLKDKFNNIDLQQLKKDMPNKKDMKEIIKKLDINLEQLDLKVDIGIDNVILTSAIVAIISAVLGIALSQVIKRYNKDSYKYVITPLYIGKNVIKVTLNCIIQVKVVHIIYIIYILFKKRRVYKHERTSNRRSYDYSYE